MGSRHCSIYTRLQTQTGWRIVPAYNRALATEVLLLRGCYNCLVTGALALPGRVGRSRLAMPNQHARSARAASPGLRASEPTQNLSSTAPVLAGDALNANLA